MSATRDPDQTRALFLTLILGSVVLMFALFFVILITGGLIFYVLLVPMCIVPLGMMHYLLWGKALEEQTAGQREEAELLERIKTERPRDTRIFPRE